jgi:hypothetical protein
MPIPHGTSRNLSFVSFRSGFDVATPSTKASSNMNAEARPSLTASTAAAVPSTSETFVSLRHVFIQVA